MKYPSIENLYAAVLDEKGRPTSRGPENGFQLPAFGQIAEWNVEEKLDGTNVRVVLEDGVMTFRGRTDAAQLPPGLLAWLQASITEESFCGMFGHPDDIPPLVVLYGEGIGPKIQAAGAGYGGVQRFVLFDVLVGRNWLGRVNVEEVADQLGLEVVPLLGEEVTLSMAESLVHDAVMQTSQEHVEGIVLKTDPPLYDARFRRVVAKYKVRDL